MECVDGSIHHHRHTMIAYHAPVLATMMAPYGQHVVGASVVVVIERHGKVAAHGGISEVRISPNVGRRDTTLQLTYAFLLLCFADSTQEEIVVPMVEKDGQWYMK